MLIQNVVKKASEILGLTFDPTDAKNAETAALIGCADTVYGEIVSDYFPLLFEEEILFDGDGRGETENFTKRLLYIVSLKSGEKTVKYTVFPDAIHAENVRNTVLTVRYAYIPDKIEELTAETELNTGVSERCFALGIASEYCLLNGMFNESVLYDKRFKDSLQAASRKRGEIKIKRRNWVG
ncbi:MAG: hypothetical protein LBT20_02130 [Clostridiales bacterium]|jgi:hypothetical protein|nr:hypothetical protein [Clostridiales bacterium]